MCFSVCYSYHLQIQWCVADVGCNLTCRSHGVNIGGVVVHGAIQWERKAIIFLFSLLNWRWQLQYTLQWKSFNSPLLSLPHWVWKLYSIRSLHFQEYPVMAVSFQDSNTRNAFFWVTKPWNPQWYVGYRLCRELWTRNVQHVRYCKVIVSYSGRGKLIAGNWTVRLKSPS